MYKRKYYYNTRFSPTVIEEAFNLYLSEFKLGSDKGGFVSLEIEEEDQTWDYDTLEEFLAEYSNAESYCLQHSAQKGRIIIGGNHHSLRIQVELSKRSAIESIFNIFEKNLDKSSIQVESEPIKIFIGHGHSKQWWELKNHLHDQHGFEVSAYEIGPRAGLSVKEVLETMLNESSFAVVVLTGEDIDNEGELHARENVIHELGLFQGYLGFKRAIVLLEHGVKEFSNILGLNQIRFSKGHIRETFGDVLATIKREFEQENS
jgi:predicted nucleotide-binding protein